RGFPQKYTNYWTACYYINARQFSKALEVLVKLQAAVAASSDVNFKSGISVKLSDCYKELGEPGMQEKQILKARTANPQDFTVRLHYIANLRNQGDIAGAIKEYRDLAQKMPAVRPNLVHLLIEQNQPRPESQRDWREAEELIDQVAKTASEPVVPVLLRAEMFFAQGKQKAAHDQLQDAGKRFPKNTDVRIVQAKLTGFQGRTDDALKLVDRAEQELGDQVDLRLERARLWSLKKGPQFHKVLMDLGQNAEKFSKNDRK